MNRRKISSRWMVGTTVVLSVLSGCAARGPATKDELCTDFDAVSNQLYRGVFSDNGVFRAAGPSPSRIPAATHWASTSEACG